MSASAVAPPRTSVLSRADLRIVGCLGGLGGALALRVVVAGNAGARSVGAGVLFAFALAAVALLTRAGTRAAPVPRSLVAGLLGAAVLCVPAALRHTDGLIPASPLHAYPLWALGVVAVAIAEEALLRGALYAAVETRAGTAAAIGVAAVAFGLLHVPLYGWGVLPLDIAVGVWLGALRAVSGSAAAPAIAHTLADLAGWWLR